MASTSEAAIEARPSSEPPIGRRLPIRMMSANATPGMTGISQACSRNHAAGSSAATSSITDRPLARRLARSHSSLHLAELVERDGAAVAVHQQHHAEPDADLGGGDRDDVQGEDLAIDVAVHEGERDEVEVHGVENELHRHQHHHGVAPGEHAEHADAEQDRAEQEEVRRQHAQSFLARTMAPIAAASRMNEIARNGTRYVDSTSSEIASVLVGPRSGSLSSPTKSTTAHDSRPSSTSATGR